MPGTKTFTGARSSFWFGGDQVAYASGCSGSEEIIYEPVDVLDHIETMEHAPVGYRVSMNASVFRTVAVGASSKASPGSLKQIGLFPKFKDILTKEGVDCFVQDSITGKILYMMIETKTSRYDFNITARGLVGQNVAFVGKRMMDESEIGQS